MDDLGDSRWRVLPGIFGLAGQRWPVRPPAEVETSQDEADAATDESADSATDTSLDSALG